MQSIVKSRLNYAWGIAYSGYLGGAVGYFPLARKNQPWPYEIIMRKHNMKKFRINSELNKVNSTNYYPDIILFTWKLKMKYFIDNNILENLFSHLLSNTENIFFAIWPTVVSG